MIHLRKPASELFEALAYPVKRDAGRYEFAQAPGGPAVYLVLPFKSTKWVKSTRQGKRQLFMLALICALNHALRFAPAAIVGVANLDRSCPLKSDAGPFQVRTSFPEYQFCTVTEPGNFDSHGGIRTVASVIVPGASIGVRVGIFVGTWQFHIYLIN